ncbi:MMPL family transporter [Paeniglutamicibacter sulfureus]|uniref:RND superfamily putative drug exporter n=2 Tax=Paeniglutamicibacter sulfureus TaxID=43666 RepID=A0ABU2BGW4_9MICC|nr:MMPL family transporter [Paeniglutamicibacter sulfureus]MDO2933162.1 MMPL family transporter [Paeniglutamicibacter sulfureus]MDR7357476.1 RND superfamily putative drug exporter [Paeniglutamicibacter sulfureus]
MASFLYRLGALAYARRWAVVGIWTILLLLIGLCAGAFMGKLSNTFAIPGTETQRTLDRMKVEMPELAGGTGSIVFRTPDGAELSAAQHRAIASSLDDLAAQSPITEVARPFELQAQLDEAKPQLAEGKTKLDDAATALADGKKQLEDGKVALEDAQAELDSGRVQLGNAKQELAEGRRQLAAGQAKLDAAASELEDGTATLTDGREQLAAGQKKWDAGNREYRAGAAKIADGRKALAAGQARLDAGARELEAGRAQYDAGMKKILDGRSRNSVEKQLAAGKQQATTGLARVDSGLKDLDAGIAHVRKLAAAAEKKLAGATTEAGKQAAQQELDSLTAKLTGLEAERKSVAGTKTGLEKNLRDIADATAGLSTLDAAKAKLDAGAKELASGQQTLKTKKAELEAGAAKLPAAKQQLDAGAGELAANRAKLRDAEAKIAEGRAQLRSGQAEIDANAAKLSAGQQEIETSQAKLVAGQKTVDEKTAALPEAEEKLERGARDLAAGRAELAFAERQAGASEGMRFVSADGSTAVAHVTFVGATDSLTTDQRAAIQGIAAGPESAGVEVLFSKEIIQDLSSIFGAAEIIGLAVAAAVLLAMLGTLVAAGLPLVMAVLGVGAGVGGTLALSSVIEMASITPALALMLGLAVGIDYSLFIVHRHRRQLLEGVPLGDSIARATGTSGNAVVFAGLTVVIALSALAVPGLPFLTVLGASAAFTVLMAVLIAITLTPALLGIIGTRLVSKRAWARAREADADAAAPTNAAGNRGWGALVTRRPWIAAIASIAVLAIVALPALELRTALPDGSAEPVDSGAYKAYEQMSDAFGAGYNGPLLVLADLPAGLDERGADTANLDVADAVRQIPGVVAAIPVAVNESRNLGAIQVIPAEGPASAQTEALVHALRDAAPGIEEATGAHIAVTGQVAAQVDVSEKLAEALPPYIFIVVGLSLILLLLVFRSVVVPLLATAGFLLSLAAAFGATVAVYQFGWLGEVFDVNVPGPIMSFLPILLTGILFGLAMDYQVFLVAGMRESFAHGQPARAAVRSGFAHAAPVVTAAALIMMAVFAGFVFSHLTMIRAIGFSLAIGVLFDAFIVRMTLTPAIMHLLGHRAWYIPRWLDRILPDVDVEGAKIAARTAAKQDGTATDSGTQAPPARDTVDA